MEDFRYEYYSPNKGYEEIQAHIFNTNTNEGVIAKRILKKNSIKRKKILN
jgi:hypothetical protein